MHWFLDPVLKQYADFKGRATRQEFWMFTLLYMILVISLMVGTFVGMFSGGAFGIVTLILVLLILALLIPSIAITVRRLHDIGRSGWWWLLNFVPYVGGLVVVVMCCLPSQKGTNAYGANKLEPETTVVPTQQETPQVA